MHYNFVFIRTYSFKRTNQRRHPNAAVDRYVLRDCLPRWPTAPMKSYLNTVWRRMVDTYCIPYGDPRAFLITPQFYSFFSTHISSTHQTFIVPWQMTQKERSSRLISSLQEILVVWHETCEDVPNGSCRSNGSKFRGYTRTPYSHGNVNQYHGTSV
jgi:hypothetical protein